jgi:hypothetical protein
MIEPIIQALGNGAKRGTKAQSGLGSTTGFALLGLDLKPSLREQ